MIRFSSPDDLEHAYESLQEKLRHRAPDEGGSGQDLTTGEECNNNDNEIRPKEKASDCSEETSEESTASVSSSGRIPTSPTKQP